MNFLAEQRTKNYNRTDLHLDLAIRNSHLVEDPFGDKNQMFQLCMKGYNNYD